jgi:hypothetical protein
MKKREQAKKDYSKMREKMVGKGKDLETTRKIVGEAKKLADKDYDKDGKVESPKDEVWGSRLRAAKLAGKLKEEEQIDELSRETKKSYVSKRGSQLSSMSYGPDKNNNTLTGRQQKNAVVGIKRAMKEEQIDEAAYSAKAARAGKDIGKPGKQFSKIAKSAAKKYGSEERGKKVAGAILSRIRAKHMKEENLEELSAFGKAFAAAKGQNFSFGGKQYSGARADGKTSTASSSMPTPAPTSAPMPPKKPESMSLPTIDKGPAPGPASTPQAAAAAAAAKPSVPTPPSRPAGVGTSEPGADASKNVQKLMKMNESVQVGANKYRIV